MEASKAWYLSRTVWGAPIAVAASLSQAMGIELQAGDQADLVEMLVALGGAAGAFVAFYGRLRARSALTKRP